MEKNKQEHTHPGIWTVIAIISIVLIWNILPTEKPEIVYSEPQVVESANLVFEFDYNDNTEEGIRVYDETYTLLSDYNNKTIEAREGFIYGLPIRFFTANERTNESIICVHFNYYAIEDIEINNLRIIAPPDELLAIDKNYDFSCFKVPEIRTYEDYRDTLVIHMGYEIKEDSIIKLEWINS